MSAPSSGQVLDRSRERGLADVVELILDKGLVIDVFARVSVIGIEIITVEIRVVVASIDTYLRYAEAIQQLTRSAGEPPGLTAPTRKLDEDAADAALAVEPAGARTPQPARRPSASGD